MNEKYPLSRTLQISSTIIKTITHKIDGNTEQLTLKKHIPTESDDEHKVRTKVNDIRSDFARERVSRGELRIYYLFRGT